LTLIRIFFRRLHTTRNVPDDECETPAFLKIKKKKPLHDSLYDIAHIWDLNEILRIVTYESELRNQAIITLLWDLDAPPHEITALRIKDVILREQYGEGIIPSNTNTVDHVTNVPSFVGSETSPV
jgi:integrase/recombinase XerD